MKTREVFFTKIQYEMIGYLKLLRVVMVLLTRQMQLISIQSDIGK